MTARHNTLWTFLISSIATFMVTLDNLVVTTSLPVIRDELGASLEALEWTVNAYTLTFAMGTSLAGVAGALAAPMVSLSPTMGSQIIIETFAVVVIGGLGSLPGSLIGALIVGELEAFGILIAPEIALPLLYLLMAVILVIRPTGLLGTADR